MNNKIILKGVYNNISPKNINNVSYRFTAGVGDVKTSIRRTSDNMKATNGMRHLLITNVDDIINNISINVTQGIIKVYFFNGDTYPSNINEIIQTNYFLISKDNKLVSFKNPMNNFAVLMFRTGLTTFSVFANIISPTTKSDLYNIYL